MTYRREHHRLIASVLGVLNADVLREHRAYFGGGTALALRFGEYRQSVDIDFLVSDTDCYRDVRAAVRRDDDLSLILLPGQRTVDVHELRSDGYGIRARLDVAGIPVKFEIIHEGRIHLETPAPADQVLAVSTVALVDLVATKLLANSDRWSDPTVFSRDIIDLAMIR